MSSTSTSVSRRDAAIAAALAGTVVVVLGYASGLGVTVEPAITTLSPAQPMEPFSPVPEPAPTTEVAPVQAVAPVPAAVPTQPASETPEMPDQPSHPMPTEPAPDPGPTTDPDPTTDPPDPEEPECSSLLEELPIVGPATVPITSLLGDLLVSTQDAIGLDLPAASPADPGSLDCILGAVVGPACCGSAKTNRRGSTR